MPFFYGLIQKKCLQTIRHSKVVTCFMALHTCKIFKRNHRLKKEKIIYNRYIFYCKLFCLFIFFDFYDL